MIKSLTIPEEPAACIDHLISLLRIEPDAGEEILLRVFLRSTSEWAVKYMNRTLIDRDWVMTLDNWPWQTDSYGLALEYTNRERSINLPYPPIVEVEEIVTVEEDGTEEAITDLYRVDIDSEPGKIIFNGTAAMLTTQKPSGIKIYYSAGYGEDFHSIPPAIQLGILKHCAYMYEHRGDSPEEAEAAEKSGAKLLYKPYRLEPV